MKKKILVICALISLFTSSFSYALDSRLKVMTTMAGYGIVGGAILGTATLAFGTSGRAIAKGASLGLYTGLLFGGYMILSYEYRKRGWGDNKERDDYYPDAQGVYENPQTSIKDLKRAKDQVLVYVNLFQHQF